MIVSMFAVSDAVLLSGINSLFSFLGMVFTGLLTYQTAKLNTKATEAVVKVTAAVAEQVAGVKTTPQTLVHTTTDKLNGISDQEKLVEEVNLADFVPEVTARD